MLRMQADRSKTPRTRGRRGVGSVVERKWPSGRITYQAKMPLGTGKYEWLGTHDSWQAADKDRRAYLKGVEDGLIRPEVPKPSVARANFSVGELLDDWIARKKHRWEETTLASYLWQINR